MTRIDNFRADARRWGWIPSLFVRAVSWARKYAGIHIYRVNVRPLRRRPEAPAISAEIELRIVGLEEMLEAASDPELDLDRDFVRAAVARGDVAFGAFDGNRLVAYAWRTFTCAPDANGLWVKVERPHHYAYKAFTRPAYRGRHIHTAISLVLSDPYFLERGYDAEVGFSEITNLAGIAVANSIGRRRVGFAGYVKWFGLCVPFRTSGTKKAGFALFKPDR